MHCCQYVLWLIHIHLCEFLAHRGKELKKQSDQKLQLVRKTAFIAKPKLTQYNNTETPA